MLAGSVAGVAFADSNAQSTPAQTKAAYYQTFVSDLATNLGISQDQVTAALDATKKQMVQEAVQQGKITQTQADKILAEKGFEFGMGEFHHGKGDITKNTNFLNNASSVLGITSDQLKSDLQAGKKLDQIITDHGMTMDQFRQKMPLSQKKDADGTANSTSTSSGTSTTSSTPATTDTSTSN